MAASTSGGVNCPAAFRRDNNYVPKTVVRRTKMLKPLVYALTASLLAIVAVPAQTPKAPPATRVDNVSEAIHGVTITDPYRWLEDQNSPETRAWIEAEDRYT